MIQLQITLLITLWTLRMYSGTTEVDGYRKIYNPNTSSLCVVQEFYPTRSVLECAGQCIKDERCGSFSFQKEARKCMIYCQVLRKRVDDSATSKADPKYYTKTCPVDWIFSHSECVFVSNERRNWYKAKAKCHALGGDMLTVEKSSKYEFLKSYLNNRFIKDTDDVCVWTGGNDLDIEGQWVWQKNGNRILFNNWSPSEPNDQFGSQECMAIKKSSSWKADDEQCYFLVCHVSCQTYVTI